MIDEQSLFDRAFTSPRDHSARLALADWYEERGDLRGELLRARYGNFSVDADRLQDLIEYADDPYLHALRALKEQSFIIPCTTCHGRIDIRHPCVQGMNLCDTAWDWARWLAIAGDPRYEGIRRCLIYSCRRTFDARYGEIYVLMLQNRVQINFAPVAVPLDDLRVRFSGSLPRTCEVPVVWPEPPPPDDDDAEEEPDEEPEEPDLTDAVPYTRLQMSRTSCNATLTYQ